MQGVYAKHYGLSLVDIAKVILFVRLFDAISDPVIGYLSDNYRLRHGTRKPYMIVGAVITAVGGYFLYSPSSDVSILYFAFWFTMIFFGFTLFEIPHLAWGGEISHDAHEKTLTYNIRTAAGYSGAILFYSIPLLPIWDTPDITPETLHFSAVISLILMLPLLYFCVKKVPDGICDRQNNDDSIIDQALVDKKSSDLPKTLRSIKDNRPLLIFLSAFVFSGISLGMWYGLVFIYVDAYLGKGTLFAEINLIVFVIGVLSSLIWIKVAKFIGKRDTWLIAMILGLVVFVMTDKLSPETVTYEQILLLLSANIICFVCVESLPQSMLSDIVDYTTLKFHIYRGSSYFSIFLFLYKGTFAIGGALGFAIVGAYGFDLTKSQHLAHEVSGLMLAMTWIPGAFAVFAMIFIAMSPISARRHRVIRRRLDKLETRARNGLENTIHL